MEGVGVYEVDHRDRAFLRAYVHASAQQFICFLFKWAEFCGRQFGLGGHALETIIFCTMFDHSS
jgi:hypothetical protein